MVDTVTNLITHAYYLSGVVSRDFETVSGGQLIDGLDLLNQLIGDKRADEKAIPYYTTQFQFNSVIGQQTYFIPNLIEVETLVFFLNSVRYAMIRNPRGTYFGAPRAENIQSLMFNYHTERTFNGTNIFLYFLPNQNYVMELSGLFALNEVVLNQDLSLTLDRFYRTYLKYQLAERICDEYSYVVPPNIVERLKYYDLIIDGRTGQMDLTQNTVSTLGRMTYLTSYGQANLGRGWTIP